MRRKLIFALFIAFSLSQVKFSYGQQNKIYTGIELGPNFFPVFNTDRIYSFGFSGDIFFQYNFPKIFSLRTNLQFERDWTKQKNSYIDNYGKASSLTQLMIVDNLSAPILVRATFGKKLKFFTNIGPQFGFLTKAKNTITYVDGNTKISIETKSFNRYYIGIAYGIGIEVPVKTKYGISLEFRNLKQIYYIDQHNKMHESTIKSTNLLIGFTYKLMAPTRQTQ